MYIWYDKQTTFFYLGRHQLTLLYIRLLWIYQTLSYTHKFQGKGCKPILLHKVKMQYVPFENTYKLLSFTLEDIGTQQIAADLSNLVIYTQAIKFQGKGCKPILPHKVKIQYVHLRWCTKCFLLLWRTPVHNRLLWIYQTLSYTHRLSNSKVRVASQYYSTKSKCSMCIWDNIIHYFLLPWMIPEEISRRSVLFNN